MNSFAPQWRRMCGGLGDFARCGAIPWAIFRLPDTPIPLASEQVMSGHEEIGQGGHHEQAVAVLRQASIGHLAKPNTRLMTRKACSTLARTCDLRRFFSRSRSVSGLCRLAFRLVKSFARGAAWPIKAFWLA